MVWYYEFDHLKTPSKNHLMCIERMFWFKKKKKLRTSFNLALHSHRLLFLSRPAPKCFESQTNQVNYCCCYFCISETFSLSLTKHTKESKSFCPVLHWERAVASPYCKLEWMMSYRFLFVCLVRSIFDNKRHSFSKLGARRYREDAPPWHPRGTKPGADRLAADQRPAEFKGWTAACSFFFTEGLLFILCFNQTL